MNLEGKILRILITFYLAFSNFQQKNYDLLKLILFTCSDKYYLAQTKTNPHCTLSQHESSGGGGGVQVKLSLQDSNE